MKDGMRYTPVIMENLFRIELQPPHLNIILNLTSFLTLFAIFSFVLISPPWTLELHKDHIDRQWPKPLCIRNFWGSFIWYDPHGCLLGPSAWPLPIIGISEITRNISSTTFNHISHWQTFYPSILCTSCPLGWNFISKCYKTKAIWQVFPSSWSKVHMILVY